MSNNVFIRVRRNGKLVQFWEGHNVWTEHGRDYLARLLAYSSFGPDTPTVTSSRIKYMMVGIGGNQQGVVPGAVTAGYPAGFDPNSTTGNEYDHTYPVGPPIGTLERPVRFSGTTNPYNAAPVNDVWLSTSSLPKFSSYSTTAFSRTYRLLIDGAAGDIAYSTFTDVPLSEAGLVLSGDAVSSVIYNPVVAYVNFEPIRITNAVEVELTWDVQF